MERTTISGCHVTKFSNFAEYLEQAELGEMDSALIKDGEPTIRRSSRELGDKSFYGTDSFDEAIQLAKNGCPEYYQKIKDKEIKAQAKTIYTNATNFDVSGNEVDVGLYMLGQPECMVSFNTLEPCKYLKLFVSFCGNSGISSQTYVDRGIKILQIIDNLEAQNIRVELIAVKQTRGNSNPNGGYYTHIITVPLKLYNQPLDIDNLGFALCSPAMHRRLSFSICETEKAKIVKSMDYDGSYGSSRDIIENAPEKAQELIGFDKEAIVIPVITDNDSDLEKLEKRVKELIRGEK